MTNQMGLIFRRGILHSCLLAFSFAMPLIASAADSQKEGGNIIVSTAIAQYGTPKYKPGFKHFDYVNPEAPKGGLVRYNTTGAFDTLNPYISKGDPAPSISLIYDGLMTATIDDAGTSYGLIGEKFEYPEDHSWIIVHLNPKAKWHDGKQITADDVVWSFNTLTEKGSPIYRSYFKDIGEVTALDAGRVKFEITNPKNREALSSVGGFAILPKHYWETRDFTKPTIEIPLGSGAYRIKKVDPGKSITYELFPDYWAKDLPVNVGLNNYKYLRYDVYNDLNVAREAFKAGDLDFWTEYTSKDWVTGYDIPAVRDGRIIKREIKHKRSQGFQAHIMNLRRDVFKDPRVRQALLYAFDFEWMNKTLFYDRYQRINSFFSNTDYAANTPLTEAELALLEPYRGQLPPEVFTTPYAPPVNDGSGRIRKQLKKADALLKEAGWVIKDGKRVHQETGKELTFEKIEYDPRVVGSFKSFADNLKRLGITVTQRMMDTSQYINRRRDFDFDMISLRLIMPELPGNEQRDLWTSAGADRPGSLNLMGLKNPVVDELVEKLGTAKTKEELRTYVRVLDRVLTWQHFWIPQYYNDTDIMAYWDMFAFPDVLPERGLVTSAGWIVPEKAKKLGRFVDELETAK